ncbi:hypothetical protein JAAARDRAFT_41843 [Jaapia argillacea MUCL 33604]|uniref:Uncharacterized protein n=1 Tax=Jaapia argillacea MUCL 33604 TaxID=933084 RepID=A0A067P7I8_9AGAM|nr:hypothetical protein JAAARDRAFT_41843 [Jaapia argillacea MUCL 33604]
MDNDKSITVPMKRYRLRLIDCSMSSKNYENLRQLYVKKGRRNRSAPFYPYEKGEFHEAAAISVCQGWWKRHMLYQFQSMFVMARDWKWSGLPSEEMRVNASKPDTGEPNSTLRRMHVEKEDGYSSRRRHRLFEASKRSDELLARVMPGPGRWGYSN